ncbi:dihydroorotate dehydrogenase B (NAD(+)), electron transfer subunit [Desulfolithobacter dissulfuricans]|uniref:Dihydroorotate dehydrogenase B (NAD(+)), electron transfer subunit n=1 Tax=Desulfolithobacter dissulfuricans TaxID=2795293 RepID=A0A915XJH9_9BACT|nr:dihydroorotate dehydrogenase electron transfer subunit [Desulfolithobacter dissulfuricans]BCO10315.1 dihydroorotate dehydrogenase B (NAD(+)), electron transfer subunit [Desulfolithobacter dissulfuricans]
MSEFQEKSRIVRIESLTPVIHRLTLHAPRIAGQAFPGQFVMVRVSPTFDPLLRRPLSIHQVSSDGTVQLLFKVVGQGTRLLAGMRTGDYLDMVGPLGRGFTLERDEPFCLVGGGMGIAPLYFLAKRLLQISRHPESTVLLGARTGSELLPLEQEFLRLGCPVHSATDDGSYGHHGFVTELLDDLLARVRRVYVCGPFPMMRIAAMKCLERGVACEVSLETHMACGLGACLGCTMMGGDGAYMHVCKDGPVFPAEKVAWTL